MDELTVGAGGVRVNAAVTAGRRPLVDPAEMN